MKFVSLCIFFSIFFSFLFIPKHQVFATAPQITASPSGTINLDQSFTLSATMSGLSKNAVYRLRIALAQPGTTNYFGSTWNGSSWYNGTPAPIQYAYFLSITTDAQGSWSGDIQGKIDSDDPNFTTGSGVYDVKLGRYTQTGSSATWSDTVPITIFAPEPTPLPPTSIPTPLPTEKPPTIIPKTPVPTIKLVPSILTPTEIASLSADILGTESAVASISPITRVAAMATQKPSVIFLIVGSIIVLAAAGISGWFLFVQKRNGTIYNDNNE